MTHLTREIHRGRLLLSPPIPTMNPREKWLFDFDPEDRSELISLFENPKHFSVFRNPWVYEYFDHKTPAYSQAQWVWHSFR